MKIVFAAHSQFDDCLVVGSHQLARQLASTGHQVWHVGPPVTPFHLARIFKKTYRNRLLNSLRPPLQLQENLAAMNPRCWVPWQLAKRMLRFGNLFVMSSNIAGSLTKANGMAGIDILLVDDPRMAGLEKLLKPSVTFYRPTDLYAEMKNDPTLVTAERQLLSNCSGIVATSQPVLAHALELKPGLPSLLLENGVDFEHFYKPRPEPQEIVSIPHPRIIYVGALDFRFDSEAVGYMAKRLPEAQFIIIGPGNRTDAVRALPYSNIHVLGPKPYDSIPAFLQHSDIGFLPLVDNLANAGRSPMKLYEYGAAGLPVVARRTTELSRREEPYIQLYSLNQEAVDSVKALLKSGTDRQAVAEMSRPYSWDRKASKLLDFISGVRSAASPSATRAGLH